MRWVYGAMAAGMLLSACLLYLRAGYLLFLGENATWDVFVSLGAGSGFSALCTEYIEKAEGKGTVAERLNALERKENGEC